MTQADYEVYVERERLRLNPSQKQFGGALARDPKHEKLLHHQIMEDCKRRRWLFFHGSMAHRSHRTLGEPDYIVLAQEGRVIMCECKVGDGKNRGKLTQDQQAVHRWAALNGHKIHVVRRFSEWLAIADNTISHQIVQETIKRCFP